MVRTIETTYLQEKFKLPDDMNFASTNNSESYDQNVFKL